VSKKKRKKVVAQDSVYKAPIESTGFVNTMDEVISVKRALDGYSNVPANLGAGANNLVQTANYVMERFTWDYYTLNILFRDNWIAKAIIEKPANEMLKNGFSIHSQIEPDKIDKIMNIWRKTKTQNKFLKCLKWARLYGGCLLIPMIENQGDLSKPLDYETIMPDSYKGCFTVDRWSGVSPSIELVDNITDPDFGQPEYYDVSDNTTGKTFRIHHSRVIKMIGREMPYWEEIAETYWGASELEHVYTELKKRDDTSANISFLIFLANIRVFKMDGMSQMLSIGDQQAAQRVYETMKTMNHLMCNTGTLAIDKEEDFAMHGYSFTGINDVYESFMLDISGAAEIPVDKLFGRSPSGFNSGAETLQNYYDTIDEKRETYVREPLEKIVKIITMSALGEIPDDIEIDFNPVRRPSDLEKSDLAQKNAQPIFDAYAGGLIGKGTALKELKQQSDITGLWTNITDEMIQEAYNEDKRRETEENENRNELMAAALGDDNNVSQKEASESSIDESYKNAGFK
jgi:phage-related protein (TIGR01555 family)